MSISYDTQEHLHIISNTHTILKPAWSGVIHSTSLDSPNLPEGTHSFLQRGALSAPSLSYSRCQKGFPFCILGVARSYQPPHFRATPGFLLLAFQQGTCMMAAPWGFSHRVSCSSPLRSWRSRDNHASRSEGHTVSGRLKGLKWEKEEECR